MKTNDATRATAEALPSEPLLSYHDLESGLFDAMNMAEIACEQVERVQNRSNRTATGFHLSEGEMQLLSFAVFHASDLVNLLKKKWDDVHESNVRCKEGVSS